MSILYSKTPARSDVMHLVIHRVIHHVYLQQRTRHVMRFLIWLDCRQHNEIITLYVVFSVSYT